MAIDKGQTAGRIHDSTMKIAAVYTTEPSGVTPRKKSAAQLMLEAVRKDPKGGEQVAKAAENGAPTEALRMACREWWREVLVLALEADGALKRAK